MGRTLPQIGGGNGAQVSGRVRSIRTGHSAALRRAGLDRINIHQTRHTVAVRMLAAGQPIEKVSQFLGHSNVQITYKTYARFTPDHMADAAAILNFDIGTKPARKVP